MLGVFDCSTLTVRAVNYVLRRGVVLRKSNLVECKYGVFGLVSE